MTFKTVAAQQRIRAISRPCEHAMQCADPVYFFTVNPAQGVQCGVNLTVNVGEE